MTFFGCTLIYSLQFSCYLRRPLANRNGNINFCLFWSSCFKRIWSHNHIQSWEPFTKKPWPVFDRKQPLYCDQRIYWMINTEGQTFSWSYDLAPWPPPPHSPVSKLDRWHRGRMQKRDGRGVGERVGEEPKHTTAWFSIKYSILSDCNYLYICAFTGISDV
jgi:hypothetical protein